MSTLTELQAKVNEVIVAKDAVVSFRDAIAEAVEEGQETINQLEAVIEAKKEALMLSVDMGEAKLAKQEIDNLMQELELQRVVNKGQETAMKAEYEAVAEAFFAVHKDARAMFNGVDRQLLVDSPLGQLTANTALMEGLASDIGYSFDTVIGVLQKAGIIPYAGQYKGVNINQAYPKSEFTTVLFELKPFMYQWKQAGWFKG